MWMASDLNTLDDRRLQAAALWPEMVQHILDRSECEIRQQGRNVLGYLEKQADENQAVAHWLDGWCGVDPDTGAIPGPGAKC
jgi:hypothetical protein